MRLNAADFRKKLEEKQKQKIEEKYFIDLRNKFLSEISVSALKAALDGKYEVEIKSECVNLCAELINDFGFDLIDHDIEVDWLLESVQILTKDDLIKLDIKLRTVLKNIIKIYNPDKTPDLSKAYFEYKNCKKSLHLKVYHLIKLLSIYNYEYQENCELDLLIDAGMWSCLSLIQEEVSHYDPNNRTAIVSKFFLSWLDEKVEIIKFTSSTSPFSILNPLKLRFFDSSDGILLFSKFSDEISAKTELLQSYVTFDLEESNDYSKVIFENKCEIEVPFSSKDFQMIFNEMGFQVSSSKKSGKSNLLKSQITIKF
jgi:hypothetical protein